MSIKRHEWEDALIDAQTHGLIKDGALLVALKLAKAINWNPKNNRPAGLYWKNEDAFDDVGIARATYFRHRKSLFETGFFTEVGGNLIPHVPEKSQIETSQSHIETPQSQIETPESQLDNPLSVDTLSEDVLSVDEVSGTVASAPVVTVKYDDNSSSSLNPSLKEHTGEAGQSSSFEEHTTALNEVKETPESQVETVKDGRYWRELRKKRPLTKEENDEIAESSRRYMQKHAPVEVVGAW